MKLTQVMSHVWRLPKTGLQPPDTPVSTLSPCQGERVCPEKRHSGGRDYPHPPINTGILSDSVSCGTGTKRASITLTLWQPTILQKLKTPTYRMTITDQKSTRLGNLSELGGEPEPASAVGATHAP